MLIIRVPATIANMGPGFDSFGMAVSLYNQFHFEEAERDALVFTTSPDAAALEAEAPARNILFRAMERLYAQAGRQRPPFRVLAETDVPITRGLGSSSTAVVAGLVATNRLLGNCFPEQALLEAAIEMEGHPDNVAPALLGGVVLCDGNRPYRLPWPESWRIIALSPAYPVRTEDARRILPEQVPFADAVFNLRKAGVLTYALLREDAEAFRESLRDRLHQPYRRQLIREYDRIEQVAMDAGAYGVIISGSGSTLAIFCPDSRQARLCESLQAMIDKEGMQAALRALTADQEGALILAPSPFGG